MRLFTTVGKGPSRPSLRARPRLEELETRVVPYTTTGSAWLPVNGVSNQLITISFVPDGTWMTSGTNGNVYSNTFAKFNAKFGSAAAWENAVITAAQDWAQYANINFSIVSDNGTPSGQGNYQQGDPGMGDIRIASYPMAYNNVLGLGYYPPPTNNYSVAGDINFNSNINYNMNGTSYDLEAVAFHEIGHALGLGESTIASAAMYATYHGSMRALTSDDIAGIQAIYGPRTGDAYGGANAPVPNNSFQNAADITAQFGSAGTAQLPNLDISTAGQAEYFKFTAPQTSSTTQTGGGLVGGLVGGVVGLVGGLLGSQTTSSTTLTVSVQSTGLSLLRPSVTIYAADQTTVLGSASAAGSYNGGTLTLNVNGVTPGQQFYVKVTGADTTAFGTGAYALTLNLGTGPLPSVPLPNTETLNGAVINGGGGAPQLINSVVTGVSSLAWRVVAPTAPNDYLTTDNNDPPLPPAPPRPGTPAPVSNGAPAENVLEGQGGEGLGQQDGAPTPSADLGFAPLGAPGAAGPSNPAPSGLPWLALPVRADLTMGLSLPGSGAPLPSADVPRAPLLGLRPQNVSVAPAVPQHIPAVPAQISSGSTAPAAADWDAATAADAPAAPSSTPEALPPDLFDEVMPGPVFEEAAPVVDVAPAWRQIPDTVFAEPAALPEVSRVPPGLALEGDGNGSPPVLAGFAVLGGAWWAAVSEPAAPRSRRRLVGRRPAD